MILRVAAAMVGRVAYGGLVWGRREGRGRWVMERRKRVAPVAEMCRTGGCERDGGGGVGHEKGDADEGRGGGRVRE